MANNPVITRVPFFFQALNDGDKVLDFGSIAVTKAQVLTLLGSLTSQQISALGIDVSPSTGGGSALTKSDILTLLGSLTDDQLTALGISESQDDFVSVSISGQILTLTKRDGSTVDTTLPSNLSKSGILSALGSLTSAQLTSLGIDGDSDTIVQNLEPLYLAGANQPPPPVSATYRTGVAFNVMPSTWSSTAPTNVPENQSIWVSFAIALSSEIIRFTSVLKLDGRVLTDAQVRAKVESADDSNVLTDTLKTKLDGLEPESQDDFTGVGISGQILTLTRRNASTLDITIPSTDPESTDDFTGASISGQTLTLNRRDATNLDIIIPSNTDDITGVSLASGVLTFTKRDGTTTNITLPTPSGSGTSLTQDQIDALARAVTSQEYTLDEKNKLRDIEEDATADQTGSEIIDSIEGLIVPSSIMELSDDPTVSEKYRYSQLLGLRPLPIGFNEIEITRKLGLPPSFSGSIKFVRINNTFYISVATRTSYTSINFGAAIYFAVSPRSGTEPDEIWRVNPESGEAVIVGGERLTTDNNNPGAFPNETSSDFYLPETFHRGSLLSTGRDSAIGLFNPSPNIARISLYDAVPTVAFSAFNIGSNLNRGDNNTANINSINNVLYSIRNSSSNGLSDQLFVINDSDGSVIRRIPIRTPYDNFASDPGDYPKDGFSSFGVSNRYFSGIQFGFNTTYNGSIYAIEDEQFGFNRYPEIHGRSPIQLWRIRPTGQATRVASFLLPQVRTEEDGIVINQYIESIVSLNNKIYIRTTPENTNEDSDIDTRPITIDPNYVSASRFYSINPNSLTVDGNSTPVAFESIINFGEDYGGIGYNSGATGESRRGEYISSKMASVSPAQIPATTTFGFTRRWDKLDIEGFQSQDDFTSASISGQILTLTKRDGTDTDITIPSGSSSVAESQDDFTSASISGNTITLTKRDGSTTEIVIPSSGASVSALTPTQTATLLRLLNSQNYSATEKNNLFDLINRGKLLIGSATVIDAVANSGLLDLDLSRLYRPIHSTTVLTQPVVITLGTVLPNVIGHSVVAGTSANPTYVLGGSHGAEAVISPNYKAFLETTLAGDNLALIEVLTGTEAPTSIDIDNVNYPVSIFLVNRAETWGAGNADVYRTNGAVPKLNNGSKHSIRVNTASGFLFSSGVAEWDPINFNIKPDWDASGGSDNEILNKPTFPVARTDAEVVALVDTPKRVTELPASAEDGQEVFLEADYTTGGGLLTLVAGLLTDGDIGYTPATDGDAGGGTLNGGTSSIQGLEYIAYQPDGSFYVAVFLSDPRTLSGIIIDDEFYPLAPLTVLQQYLFYRTPAGNSPIFVVGQSYEINIEIEPGVNLFSEEELVTLTEGKYTRVDGAWDIDSLETPRRVDVLPPTGEENEEVVVIDDYTPGISAPVPLVAGVVAFDQNDEGFGFQVNLTSGEASGTLDGGSVPAMGIIEFYYETSDSAFIITFNAEPSKTVSSIIVDGVVYPATRDDGDTITFFSRSGLSISFVSGGTYQVNIGFSDGTFLFGSVGTLIEMGKYIRVGGAWVNDPRFTDVLKTKLDALPEDAEANIKPDWDAAESDTAGILNKPTIPTSTGTGTGEVINPDLLHLIQSDAVDDGIKVIIQEPGADVTTTRPAGTRVPLRDLTPQQLSGIGEIFDITRAEDTLLATTLNGIIAFDYLTGDRRSDNDIPYNSQNSTPRGISYKDGLVYVVDRLLRKVFAYRYTTKLHDSSGDINSLIGAGVVAPWGIEFHRDLLWFISDSNSGQAKVWAFSQDAGNSHSPERDFGTAIHAIYDPRGMSKHEATARTVNIVDGVNKIASGYSLLNGDRVRLLDFNTTFEGAINLLSGIYTDTTDQITFVSTELRPQVRVLRTNEVTLTIAGDSSLKTLDQQQLEEFSKSTPAQLVAKLVALIGVARLPATAIRDLPTGGGGGDISGETALRIAGDLRLDERIANVVLNHLDSPNVLLGTQADTPYEPNKILIDRKIPQVYEPKAHVSGSALTFRSGIINSGNVGINEATIGFTYASLRASPGVSAKGNLIPAQTTPTLYQLAEYDDRVRGMWSLNIFASTAEQNLVAVIFDGTEYPLIKIASSVNSPAGNVTASHYEAPLTVRTGDRNIEEDSVHRIAIRRADGTAFIGALDFGTWEPLDLGNTAEQIVTKIETLTGEDRVPASAIKDLPKDTVTLSSELVFSNDPTLYYGWGKSEGTNPFYIKGGTIEGTIPDSLLAVYSEPGDVRVWVTLGNKEIESIEINGTTLTDPAAVTIAGTNAWGQVDANIYTFQSSFIIEDGTDYEIKIQHTDGTFLLGGASLLTASQIVTSLEALTGDDRLPASAIRDLPTGSVSGDTPLRVSALPASAEEGAERYLEADVVSGGSASVPLFSVDQTFFGIGFLPSSSREGRLNGLEEDSNVTQFTYVRGTYEILLALDVSQNVSTVIVDGITTPLTLTIRNSNGSLYTSDPVTPGFIAGQTYQVNIGFSDGTFLFGSSEPATTILAGKYEYKNGAWVLVPAPLTASGIVTSLKTLTGDDRLSADEISGLPSGGTSNPYHYVARLPFDTPATTLSITSTTDWTRIPLVVDKKPASPYDRGIKTDRIFQSDFEGTVNITANDNLRIEYGIETIHHFSDIIPGASNRVSITRVHNAYAIRNSSFSLSFSDFSSNSIVPGIVPVRSALTQTQWDLLANSNVAVTINLLFKAHNNDQSTAQRAAEFTNISFESGNVVFLQLSDNSGTPGVNGVGIPGLPGADGGRGTDGRNGADGGNGTNGTNGISITSASYDNSNGQVTLTRSSGAPLVVTGFPFVTEN